MEVNGETGELPWTWTWGCSP